jgi:hypothetical protein
VLAASASWLLPDVAKSGMRPDMSVLEAVSNTRRWLAGQPAGHAASFRNNTFCGIALRRYGHSHSANHRKMMAP